MAPTLKTDRLEPIMQTDYLEKILTARVYDVAVESPLEAAPLLSERLGHTLLLKREDMQSVFSFKLRGAYNKMVQLTPEARSARRHCGLGRQSRPGRRPGGANPGVQRRDRHARHHAADQN